MKPGIDIIRGSVSRPEFLKESTPTLLKHLKYSGELKHTILESVFVNSKSKGNKKFAKENHFNYHEINPQAGYGVALKYALDYIVNSKYMINWEDDYSAVKDINLDECISVMERYPKVNQICFNKRPTLAFKWVRLKDNKYKWYKEPRVFKVGNRKYYLVVKEKWWFGPAIWRVDYIKDKFVGYNKDVHHLLNDNILLPLAGAKEGYFPNAKEVEDNIGCYIWGKTGDSPMTKHIGVHNSVYLRELTEKWKIEGEEIKGDIN